jgi:hypothetical protein
VQSAPSVPPSDVAVSEEEESEGERKREQAEGLGLCCFGLGYMRRKIGSQREWAEASKRSRALWRRRRNRRHKQWHRRLRRVGRRSRRVQRSSATCWTISMSSYTPLWMSTSHVSRRLSTRWCRLSVCLFVCVCVCVSCNFRDCNFFACGRAGAEGFILWFLQTLLSSVFLCCFAFFFFFFFRFQISDDVFFFIIVFFFSLVVIADFLNLIVVWMWCLSSYSLIVCGGESCMYFGPVTKENLCTIVASARRGKDCSSSKFPLTCNNLFLIFYVGKNCLWQQAWLTTSLENRWD